MILLGVDGAPLEVESGVPDTPLVVIVDGVGVVPLEVAAGVGGAGIVLVVSK